MLKTTLDTKSLEDVSNVIEQLGFNVRRELKTAVSKTQKKVKTAAARKLRDVLKAPVRVLKKAIVNGKSENDGLIAVVLMKQGYKIPLKYLGARQTKKGVAYRINSSNKGIVSGAFIVKSYRGNVYTRKTPKRAPLDRQVGPAPGEMYQSAGVAERALAVAEEELPKQIQERIRFLTLKAQGKLK